MAPLLLHVLILSIIDHSSFTQDGPLTVRAVDTQCCGFGSQKESDLISPEYNSGIENNMEVRQK